MKPKKLFDTPDSAKLLKIHSETLRKLMRQGEIRPVRGGPPYLFDLKTLKSFTPRKPGRPRLIFVKGRRWENVKERANRNA